VAEDDSSEPPHLTNMKRKRMRQLSKPSHNAAGSDIERGRGE
jgi:hypothetical protein